MSYIDKMNNALDYIESNLNGEIDYKIAANKACCSVSYFRRVFSLILDVSLSEYIRRRRMTLAAFELQNSDIKIIDLAFKYGYQSPDSFTRAFKNLHGVLPSEVHSVNTTLKAYPPISFQISIKGEVSMNYRIEEKEEFRVVGIRRRYQGPEDDPSIIASFWNELYANGTINKISKLSTGNPKGVHGFIQVLGEEKISYTIACLSDKEVPEGMCTQIVPKSTWAIFEIIGPVNTAIKKAWKSIFTEWLPTSSYKYAETIDIECFPYGGENGKDKKSKDFKFEIWLPVIKNENN